MVLVDVKGIHRVTKRLAGGKTVIYHYAWRGGPRFWRSDTGPKIGSPDYWAAHRTALEERSPSKGTFREIIISFTQSREFAALADRTRKDYAKSIAMKGGIDEKFGSAPLAVFNRPEIRRIAYAWRDTFRSPRVADHLKTHMVKIVNWAVDRGWLTVNHLAGMSNLYEVDRADLIWTNSEIEAFIDGAPDYLRRILITATETGLRPQDLCILSRSHIRSTPKGRRIVLRTQKRNRLVSVPITPRMAEVLDATPRDRMVILVGEKGQPYAKANSMSRQVARRRAELAELAAEKGLPPPIRPVLHFYDCRGTAATRLFEADATLREIALHMGWSVQTAAKMIEVYAATNPDTSDSVLVKLAGAMDR